MSLVASSSLYVPGPSLTNFRDFDSGRIKPCDSL